MIGGYEPAKLRLRTGTLHASRRRQAGVPDMHRWRHGEQREPWCRRWGSCLKVEREARRPSA